MITSPEQEELDKVKDNVLVPKSDVNIGTAAASGFAFEDSREQSELIAESVKDRKLKKRLEQASPVLVNSLTQTEEPELQGIDGTLVNSFGPMGFDKRLKLTPPETAVWSAAWHRSFPGVTADYVQAQLEKYTPDPNYNVWNDIPDEYLDAQHFKYYATSVNSDDTQDRTNKIRQRELWEYSIAESPWQYAGAALMLGFVDPWTYALPGGALRKGAAELLAQGGKALLSKEVIRATALTGAAGATQELITESARSLTQEVTLEEAAYSTLTAGLLSSVLGGTILGGVSAKAARDLRKTTASILSSGVDVPSQPSLNANFKMPGYNDVGAMQVTGELGTPPKAPMRPEAILLKTPVIHQMTKFGPLGTLINSESPTANYIANDMFIHNYETSAIIKANQPLAVSVQALMDEYAGAFTKAGVEINKIFREQFGIGDSFAAGMRTRLASAMASGENLNIDNFSRAVSDVMDTGVPHPSPYVMRAAKVAQDTLRVAKEELVKIGKMGEHFLLPEFDNYFTRMWIKQFLIEKPDDFKFLLKAWFKECNTYYENNAEPINALHQPIIKLQKEIDFTKKRLAMGRQSPEYQLRRQKKLLVKEEFKRQRETFKQERKFVNDTIKTLQKEIENLSKVKSPTKEQKAELKSKAQAIKDFEKNILSQKSARDLLKDIERLEKLQSPTGKERQALRNKQRKFNELVYGLQNEPTATNARKILIDEIEALEKLPTLNKREKALLKSKRKQLKEHEAFLTKLEEEFKVSEARVKEQVSEKNTALPEMRDKLEQLQKQLAEAQKKLYDFIPPKYLTIDGHIPRVKEDFELDAAVQQTYERMTGNDVDSFMNPISLGTGTGSPDPIQVRALTIPLDFFVDVAEGTGYRRINARDFLSRDVFKMLANYERSTNSEIALTKLAHARGFDSIADLKRGYAEHLNDDYARLKVGATPKRAKKLDDALKRDKKALEETFAIMEMGTPYKALDGSSLAKFSKNMQDYTAARYLGSAGIAVIGEVFVPVARQGFINSIGPWIGEVCLGFAKAAHAGSAADRELFRKLGFCMRTEIGMRQRAFINEQDGLINYTWWKETSSFVKDTFSNLTCMNQLADFNERVGGTLSIDRTFSILRKKFEKGIYSEADRIRMRKVGISEESEEILYRMWREGKGSSYLGTYYSNYGNWNINTPNRMRAAQEFRTSIINDVNLSKLEADIQDVPSVLYHPVAKPLFQFKSWMLAANSRIIFNGLQRLSRGDLSFVLDVMFLMAGGALTYVLNALAKNPTETPDLSLEKLAKEGVDRGGIFGLLIEPYNVAQKWGIIPGDVVSRYQSRGSIEALLGPALGGVAEIGWNIGNIRKGISGEIDYSTKQANDIKHLAIYQNIWFGRYLFDQAFMNAAVGLGVTDKRKQ